MTTLETEAILNSKGAYLERKEMINNLVRERFGLTPDEIVSQYAFSSFPFDHKEHHLRLCCRLTERILQDSVNQVTDEINNVFIEASQMILDTA